MTCRALVVLLLASSCAANSSGPAWPAPSDGEDGGESIAPRKSATTEVSLEDRAESEPIAAPVTAKPAATKAPAAQQSVPNAAPPKPKPKPKPTQAPVEPPTRDILAPPPKKRR